MFSKLSSFLMNAAADIAWETAIYSADVASGCGMHQIEEPADLQAVAKAYKADK